MTTHTFTSTISHGSDAGFRSWAGQISAAFDALGMFPKSGDTGQADFTTVARPGPSTMVYEIRYLNDSLHATYPLYVKIEYGTGDNTNTPDLYITVGTGTNGAGTITGVRCSRSRTGCNSTVAGASYPSFFCGLPGYVAMAAFRGCSNNSGPGSLSFFAVCRSVDTSGTISGEGVCMYFMDVAYGMNRRSYGRSETADGRGVCIWPSALTSTLISGTAQVIRHFMCLPAIRCVPFLVSYVNGEIGSQTTFTATPIGATARTYLTLGGTTEGPLNCGLTINGVFTNLRIAMQYE